MQIKRVSVFRQGKLCRKAFQTEEITFPDSQVIRAYNTWFCHEHCSSEDFRRGHSVRTSTLENLVGNQWETMGICCLAPCLLQPSSHSVTSTARIQPMCASLTCSLKVPTRNDDASPTEQKREIKQAVAECRQKGKNLLLPFKQSLNRATRFSP